MDNIPPDLNNPDKSQASSAQTLPANDIDAEALSPKSPTRRKFSNKLLLSGAVVILIIVIVGGWLIYTHQSMTNKSTSNNEATKTGAIKADSKICTIETNKVTDLDCYDSAATNKIIYELPNINGQSISGLVPSPDGSSYIASNISGSLWLLSDKLTLLRQLQLPVGLSYTPGTVSWSHDSKSLFLELDTAGGSRQIYQYTLASDKSTQITNNNGINTDPFQTSDGHIIYVYWLGQNPQVPYIMNDDGSDPRALNSLIIPNYSEGIYTNSFSGGAMSYDQVTDTVFITESNPSSPTASSSDLVYSTIAGLLNGAKPTTLVTDNSVCQLGSTIVRLNTQQVICNLPVNSDLTIGNIFQLSGDKVQATISPYDAPVEVLNSTP